MRAECVIDPIIIVNDVRHIDRVILSTAVFHRLCIAGDLPTKFVWITDDVHLVTGSIAVDVGTTGYGGGCWDPIERISLTNFCA